ncbi:MAG: prenyltransferase/squalene oxidase repeat-containing protein [Clostridia bacterium]|nr:prenyltransferase/squalene oxidase repeat-containing protein [Clostridia bacterium]
MSKKVFKIKIVALLVTVLMLLNCTVVTATDFAKGNEAFESVVSDSTYPDNKVLKRIEKTLEYLLAVQNNDGGFPGEAGQKSSRTITDWTIMALCAVGEDPNSEKWTKNGHSSLDYIESSTYLLKATNDYSRTLLALSAGDKGTVYNGEDIAKKIISFQQENGQFAQLDQGERDMVNAHMWAVLALASTGQEIPNREKACKWLISQQNEDGGFCWLVGGESDPDDTGIAIATLNVLGEPQDSVIMKNAVDYLENQRDEEGGYCWNGQESNIASDAWVIQGFQAVGKTPDYTHLLSLQSNEGYFNWTEDKVSSPVLMTAYAMIALSGQSFPVNGICSADEERHKGTVLLRPSFLGQNRGQELLFPFAFIWGFR